MAEHHLVGEQGAGDGRVERCRHGGGDAAPEQGARQGRREPQPLGQPTAQPGAKVHRRSLAADGGADADGGGVDHGGAQTRRRRHAPAMQGAGLDDVGDPVVAPPGQQAMDQQPDKQSAGRRRGQNVPPPESLHVGIKVVGRGTEEDGLNQADPFAEQDDAPARGGTRHQGQNGQDQLVVPDHPAQPHHHAAHLRAMAGHGSPPAADGALVMGTLCEKSLYGPTVRGMRERSGGRRR